MVWRRQVPLQFYRPHGPWYDRPEAHIIRPRTWWRSLLLDWLFIVISYLLAGLFFWVVPAPRQYYMLGDPSLSYPIVPERIGTAWTLLLSWGVPIIVIVLSWYFLFGRYKRDLFANLTGLFEALGLSLLISSLFWKLMGGLRPSFYAMCAPDPSKPYVTYVLGGTKYNYYDQSACTKELLNDELHGFPSGHSATAWAGWVYTAMYLSSRSRLWYDGSGYYWKLLVFGLLPLIIPTWVAVSRVTDYLHTWGQSVVGALIGLLVALLVYRLRHVDNAWTRDGHITHHMAQQATREEVI